MYSGLDKYAIVWLPCDITIHGCGKWSGIHDGVRIIVANIAVTSCRAVTWCTEALCSTRPNKTENKTVSSTKNTHLVKPTLPLPPDTGLNGGKALAHAGRGKQLDGATRGEALSKL
jgi:hypothetical protein